MRTFLGHLRSTRGEPELTTRRQPTDSPTTASEDAEQAASSIASADDVMDVASVGKILRIGRNKIYEMVARNQIPHRRFGRRIRFSRAAIMRWLDSWSLQSAKKGH